MIAIFAELKLKPRLSNTFLGYMILCACIINFHGYKCLIVEYIGAPDNSREVLLI